MADVDHFVNSPVAISHCLILHHSGSFCSQNNHFKNKKN